MTAEAPAQLVAPDEPGYDAGERLVRVEVGLGLLSTQVTRMESGMDRLERNVSGRPSWIATTLLSLSTMANGALAAAVVALVTTRH